MDALKTVPAQHEAGDLLSRICAFPGAAVITLHLDSPLTLRHGDHIAASASAAFHDTSASASLMRVTWT